LDCRNCSHFAETDRRSAEHCVRGAADLNYFYPVTLHRNAIK
jgi:hypothetical protein